MILKIDVKIEEKLTCGLEKDTKNLAKLKKIQKKKVSQFA